MRVKTFLVSISAAVFVIGCGGGGGGVSLPSKPNESQMLRLDDSNAKKSSEATIITIVGSNDVSQNPIPGSNMRLKNKLVKLKKIIPQKLNRSITKECVTGSIQIVEKNENSGSIIYHNCKLNDVVYNGTIKVSLPNGDDSIIKGEIINLSAYDAKESVKIDYAQITIDTIEERTQYKKFYATLKRKAGIEKYLNFNIDVRNTFNGLVYKVDGYIKPLCLNNFVYVKTLPQVEIEFENEEITNASGKLKVASKNKTVIVEFKGENVTITKPSGNSETLTFEEFKNETKNSCSLN